MSKIFANIFPFFDYLYIFQIFEYETDRFLNWFILNPLKRNLQKKHRLDLTSKATLLSLISLTLMTIPSLIISINLFHSLFWIPILLLLLSSLSPVFLVIGQLLLLPLESYKKDQIIEAAKDKLENSKNLEVIAIVGSFAKTSIKEILYTLLWKDYRVIKTPKSFNTPLSISRTILEMVKDNTQYLIVEMDAYHPGDIDSLCRMVKPKYGIITSIAPQHLERFGSMENLAQAQFELADNLPVYGALFLNLDSPWVDKLSNYRSDRFETILFGEDAGSYYASNIKQTPVGIFFTLHTPKGSIQIELPLFGEHHAQNFTAAAAIAHKIGLSLKTIQQRAELILPTEHRLEVKQSGSMTIIDNTYNSNPSAVKASLKLLHDLPGSQKVLITPGLIELGTSSREENIKFMKQAAQVADDIVIVGNNAREDLLEGLRESSYPEERTHLSKSAQEGLMFMSHIAKPNTVILLENDLPDQYF